MVEIRRKIPIPIYGGTIIVVITDDIDVRTAALNHFKVDDPSLKDYQAVVLQSNSTLYYPALFSGKLSPGLIAHEAKHILNSLFQDIGQKLDQENDEVEAYLLSWIVNRIWEVNIKFLKLK